MIRRTKTETTLVPPPPPPAPPRDPWEEPQMDAATPDTSPVAEEWVQFPPVGSASHEEGAVAILDETEDSGGDSSQVPPSAQVGVSEDSEADTAPEIDTALQASDADLCATKSDEPVSGVDKVGDTAGEIAGEIAQDTLPPPLASNQEDTSLRDDSSVLDADVLPESRRVKVVVSRINPLSAMKVGFMVAVALALVQIVAAIVLWLVLDLLHVFSSMQMFIEAVGATAIVNLMDVLQFSRAIALVTIIGIFQVLVLTVLAWLGAVIYNLITRMVGGLHIVLTDD